MPAATKPHWIFTGALILVAQLAWAQPTQWEPLQREVYALDLERVNGDSLPWLLRATQTARELAAAEGRPGANRLIRTLVVLRQLAQVQDTRMVDLRSVDGRLIGDDRAVEAERLKEAIRGLKSGATPVAATDAFVPAPRPPGTPDMLNREVSFLEFNKRVLDMAKDPRVPLQERVSFLTIVSSNMDEFYQIRVAGLKEEAGRAVESRRSDGFTARETLPLVLAQAQALHAEQQRVYAELRAELQAEGIRVMDPSEVRETRADREWAREYLAREVAPKIQPIEVQENRPFPRVADKGLNLLVTYTDGRRAVVPLNGELAGMVQVPGRGDRVLLVSDLIAEKPKRVFGNEVASVSTFRVTRNHDLWGRDGIAREFGRPVRLEASSRTDAEFLRQVHGLKAEEVMVSRGPVDLSRVGDIKDVERADLRFEKTPPTRPADMQPGSNLFETISRGERLLHHPFQSYDPVVELVQQASQDPRVLRIQQTLYRTGGSGSPIVEALVKAAEAGKPVTVLVETRARFDEKSNVENVRRLRAAGANVIYGPPGLKTHAKLLAIDRMENNRIERYVHMGTGNYNDKSARFYTDFSLFTKDPSVGRDVENVFRQLKGEATGTGAPELDRVLMAPFTLKETILEGIRREAANARAGKPASITAKMNSLNDPDIIRALYQASQAGVKVDLIVRGLTTIRPGVPGMSENIRVRSILGQYLEHTRVFQFHDGGRGTTYLGSADWMVRNTERRVETAIRVDDARIKSELRGVLDTYLKDNTQAWELKSDGTYKRVQPAAGEAAYNAQRELASRGGETLPDLSRFRRADGTLNWERLRESRVLREGAGLAHFALALFLKELAVVVSTGDRSRIEEFFDGLKTWDFYKHYGLFVAGARLSEVAYTKYLERYVRPGFVNGLLKTNVVLAAGLALPMIVEGQFSGRVFIISLASLGISSALVRGGMQSIKWVMSLRKAQSAGVLARFGARAGKLASVAGWFYTAVELAVILTVAEYADGVINSWWDMRVARDRLKDSARAMLAVVDDPSATPEAIEAALKEYHEAWIAYRNFLYRPLEIAEARMSARMEKVAREAKILDDRRRAAVERRSRYEHLTSALDRYVDNIDRNERAELDEDVNMYFASYQRERESELREIYFGNQRGWSMFEDDHSNEGIVKAHGRSSRNRLESYDDEDEVLAEVAARLQDRADLLAPVERLRAINRKTQRMDRQLVEPDAKGLVDLRDTSWSPGNMPLGEETVFTED